MFAEPPAEAKAAPLTAAQLQAGRPLNGGGAGGAPAQKMPVVKLVDLGMACLYDPAKQITGAPREGAQGGRGGWVGVGGAGACARGCSNGSVAGSVGREQARVPACAPARRPARLLRFDWPNQAFAQVLAWSLALDQHSRC